MERTILLITAIVIATTQSIAQAQEKGSQAEARILAGRSAGRAIEKGSAAESRMLSGGRDANRIAEAGRRKAASERRERAEATPTKDRLMIDFIVGRLNAGSGTPKYHFADNLESADLGAVIRIRPFSYKNEDGETTNVKPSARILSIKDSLSALVEIRSTSPKTDDKAKTREFVLRGVATSTYKGRQSIPLDGFFVIDHPDDRAAAKGHSQMTLQLKLIDIKAYEEEREHVAEELVKQQDAAAQAEREASFRKWTSSNGNHVVEALLSSYANGSVTLELRDGKKVKVDVTKLSEDDQAYVTKWRHDKH
jgi:hypothetical protein